MRTTLNPACPARILTAGIVALSACLATALASDFAIGEAIVKLKPGSGIDQALAAPQGLRKDSPVHGYVHRLGGRLNIPLSAKQLTSGREILLAVDQRGVKKRLRKELTQLLPGAQVKDLPGQAGVSVETRDSSALETLQSEIQDRTGWALAVQPAVGGLTLVVNLEALTLELVKRLTEQPDVRYAQPNFVLGHQ